MIREANINDFERLMKLERDSFNEDEVVTEKGFRYRLANYPDHTLVIEENNDICAYITYVLSDELKLEDIMFTDDVVDMEKGNYIIVLGLATDPLHKKKGFASKLMKHLINITDKTILLTCHDYLIDFYSHLGFKVLGISESSVANSTWYDMVYEK